jgi:hypothetical protein
VESALVLAVPAESTATQAAQPPAQPDPGLAAKAGLTLHPSKRQSQRRQLQDEQACYRWAEERTGVDPVSPTFGKAMATCLQRRGYAVN